MFVVFVPGFVMFMPGFMMIFMVMVAGLRHGTSG